MNHNREKEDFFSFGNQERLKKNSFNILLYVVTVYRICHLISFIIDKL